MPARKFALSAAVLALAMTASARPAASPLQQAEQILVVTTPDWNAVDGRLQFYQRANPQGRWQPVGATVPVVMGRAGMGWGRGVLTMTTVERPADPVKREGDHRSPAGVFRLGEAFGYAATPPAGWQVHYRPLKETTDCVDDPQSRHYNQIVERGAGMDWKSAEHMRDAGEAYRWGMVVENNSATPLPGRGSCVFLHIWDGPGKGTEGCTAMPEEQVTALLGRLRPDAHPLLIQMPAEEYRQLAKRLALPALSEGTQP